MSERTPASPCRVCGAKLDGAYAPGARMPTPGDVSVCVYCAAVSIYTDDLLLRAPTATELAEITIDPRVWRMVAAARRRASRRN